MRAGSTGLAVVGTAFVCGLIVAVASTTEASRENVGGKLDRQLRLGTYESRAIAVAFAHSRFNTIVEKLTEELKAAEAAGDHARAAEIRKKGELYQRRLHRQGFSSVPVDDLLAHIKDKLAAVCAETKVDAIATGVTHAGPDVEVVDVTDQLVKEYAPTERTLNWIADLRKRPPIDLDDLSHEH